MTKKHLIVELNVALADFGLAAYDNYGSDSYAAGFLGGALMAAAAKLPVKEQKALLEILQKDAEANRVKTFQRAEVRRIKAGKSVKEIA
jgi:hypothetical protein